MEIMVDPGCELRTYMDALYVDELVMTMIASGRRPIATPATR